MQLVYRGKTKDVYDLGDGNYLFKFKDDVTVDENGKFDPGANVVGATIEGMGRNDLRVTNYFFSKIAKAGIPTHFVSADLDRVEMVVKPAKVFGKGLEVVCRLKAVGSFMRRYGAYVTEGQPLDYLIEMTLKDDARDDPPITKETLDMLGILPAEGYETLKGLAKKITAIVKDDLAAKGCELYDIKFEFGYVNGQITLIDEISAGCMRVYKNGQKMEPEEIAALFM